MNSYSLYVVQGGDFCKIGRAKNLKSRLVSLQTGCPFDLVLVKSWQLNNKATASRAEEYLHDKFAAKHERGEWFRLDEEDVNYLVGLDSDSFAEDTKPWKDYSPKELPEKISLNDVGELLRGVIKESPFTIAEVGTAVGLSRRAMHHFFDESSDWRIAGAILDFLGYDTAFGFSISGQAST